MAIRELIGDTKSSIETDVEIVLSQARSKINSILGGLQTGISTMWSGGFAGIDENGIPILKQAIDKYCQSVDGQIEAFDVLAPVEIAYKGSVQEAVVIFINDIKGLLQAHSSRMKESNKVLLTAYDEYVRKTKEISQNVISNAQEIRAVAQGIKID